MLKAADTTSSSSDGSSPSALEEAAQLRAGHLQRTVGWIAERPGRHGQERGWSSKHGCESHNPWRV